MKVSHAWIVIGVVVGLWSEPICSGRKGKKSKTMDQLKEVKKTPTREEMREIGELEQGYRHPKADPGFQVI